MTHGQLTALMVGDRIERWHAIGFAEEPTITIGSTLISSVEDGSGICTAAVDQVDSLDGLALRPQAAVADAMASPAPSRHGNGVVAIDHIVVMTPDSGRTTSNFEAQDSKREGYAISARRPASVGRRSSGWVT